MIKNKIYYLLLGIGLGVIITSSVNIVFNKPKQIEYTDEQIKEKARDLGMISIKENIENMEKKDKEKPEEIEESMEEIPEDKEEEYVSEMGQNSNDIQVVEEVNQNSTYIAPTVEVKKNINNTPKSKPIVSSTSSTPKPIVQAKPGHKFVTIEPKDTATAIITKLKKAGIIENEEEFKELVIKYNLQGKLNTGAFELKLGMSYEELLKALVDEKDLKNAGFL